MPARLSALPAWEAHIGAEAAAAYRTSLARPTTGAYFVDGYYHLSRPLGEWLGDVYAGMAGGGDVASLLNQAQAKADVYLACLGQYAAPHKAEADACAAQADPAYKTLEELQGGGDD
jgi:hypothetical protein